MESSVPAPSNNPPPIPPIPAPTPQVQPAKPPVVSTPGLTMQEIKPYTWKAIAKLIFIILFGLGSALAAYIGSKQILGASPTKPAGEVLVETPYQPVLWKDFGEVFEPIIKLPLYYPSEGYQNMEFLLDSGALVSSLPREEAKKMGISLAKLPRSTFAGFGGTTSFAYKGEAQVKLGEQEVMIPVVFTEAAGTKPILGRSGFFEKFSIYFNAKSETIEIRK